MENQCQNLDALLQMNQDFGVPDQLFEDSDIGAEDVGKTVEIETGVQESESSIVLDGDNVMLSEDDVKTSEVNKLSQVTSQVGNHLPTLASTSAPQTTLEATNVQVTPTPPPPKQAPLKLVTVPINSDAITQGNSQVVLIPMGGMDSSKLESTLKVPLGQKLVIIKPQEILKTIEAKKSAQSPAVNIVHPPGNVVIVQQNTAVQGGQPAGYQQIPMTRVNQLGTSGLAPVQHGLVTLAPKPTPGLQNTQIPHATCPSQQSVPYHMRTATMQTGKNVQIVQQQSLAGNNANYSGVVTQITSPNVNAMVFPQIKMDNMFNVLDQVNTVNSIQQPLVTQQIHETLAPICSPVVQPKLLPSNQANVSLTSSQTGIAALQTGLTVLKTALSTSVTGLTTSLPQSTTQATNTAATQSIPKDKPNLYQRLKQKVTHSNEENRMYRETNISSVSQLQSLAKAVKPTLHDQKNLPISQESQNDASATNSAQNNIVTYVSPPATDKTAQKSNVGLKNTTKPIIQIPGKLEQKQNMVFPRGGNLNQSNRTAPMPSVSPPFPAHTQQLKMVPTISPHINQSRGADVETANIATTTSVSCSNSETANMGTITSASSSGETSCPSIEQHENILSSVVCKKDRGVNESVKKSVTKEAKIVPKVISGPTLKHELDRKGSTTSRLKTVKPGERQSRTVGNKRVSSNNRWVCALCGKVSFENFLGCLYGPYDGESEGSPSEKRRRGSSEDHNPRKAGGGGELWFHGECMVWSPGVFVEGESVVGYKQVVSDAQSRICNHCNKLGATLVCLQRACRKQYHFFCAKKNGCVFDESNYTILCAKHRK